MIERYRNTSFRGYDTSLYSHNPSLGYEQKCSISITEKSEQSSETRLQHEIQDAGSEPILSLFIYFVIYLRVI